MLQNDRNRFSIQPTGLENHNINRRWFLLCGLIALNAVLTGLTGRASAARLPKSTLTVNVLSVDPESTNREEVKYPGQPDVVFETTKFVAKVQITKILVNDHGLSVGAVINIRYSVTVRQPPDPGFRVRPTLSAGETKTVTVFGGYDARAGGNSFNWQN